MRRYIKYFAVLVVVLFGTTVCAQAKRDKVNRGIEKVTLIPKGYMIGGGSFTYSEVDASDYQFLVLENIQGSSCSYKISPFLGYFIADDMAIGARFSYKRSNIDLGSLNLNLEDINFDLSNYNYLQSIYSGSLFFRNYIALGKSKRFGFFNEVRLTAGGGSSKQSSGENPNEATGNYQDIFELELGLITGLIAFVTNNVAVEASVNVLGFEYQKYSQVRNQIYEGSFQSSGVNFKIDLFSINVGLSFYF